MEASNERHASGPGPLKRTTVPLLKIHLHRRQFGIGGEIRVFHDAGELLQRQAVVVIQIVLSEHLRIEDKKGKWRVKTMRVGVGDDLNAGG